MRLFKSNRSQASLSSHENKPHPNHDPNDSPPLPSPAYPPPPHAVPTDQQDGPPDFQQQQHRFSRHDENQSYPASLLTRSQSQRVSGSSYSGRATANIVGPAPGVGSEVIHETQQQFPPAPVNPPAQVEQHEPKKSKRSLFGLHSSPRDSQSNSQPSSRPSVGRSISVRRKTPSTGYLYTDQSPTNLPPIPNPEQEIERAAGIYSRVIQDQEHNPQPVYPQVHPPSAQQPLLQSSRERVTLHQVNTNPSVNEEYYQQQSEHNSPFSQTSSHQSPLQQEVHQPSPQRQFQYKAFQPSPQNNSNTYLPYQPQPQPDQISLGRNSPQLEPNRGRPASQQSFGPPSPLNPQFQTGDPKQPNHQNRNSLQSLPPPPSYHQSAMARGDAPPGHSMRPSMNQQHSQANEQGHGQGQSQGQGPNQGQPPGQDQGQERGPPQGHYGPPPQNDQRHGGQHQGGPPQGGGYKPPLAQQSSGEQGRSTPPPAKGREELMNMDKDSLVQKHEELLAKYSKVKKYYFEKDSQVAQLQNTLAHQRLSLSKTALDDNEYATRFTRLDGAINNLAFNIRKDWRAIPPWLATVTNKDAHSVGTKEMTAVGRACITRWIMDEIFDRYFHPSLEPGLSSQLKIIEKNIRRGTSVHSEEQKDDMLAKVSNWRLTTIEGLGEMLASPQAMEYRTQLTVNLTEKLNAALEMMLNDPAPPGLGQSITGIIELAIGIVANLPLESRDVHVEYYMPNAGITERYMKVEITLPPLTQPGTAPEASQQPSPADLADQSSMKSADTASLTEGGSVKDHTMTDQGDRDSIKDSSGSAGGGASIPPRGDSLPPMQQQQKDPKKKSLFGGFVNKKPPPNASENGGGPPSSSRGGSISVAPGGAAAKEAKEKEEMQQQEKQERERKIRFSAFVAVEVRGKGKGAESGNVLIRAPCYPH